METRDLQTHGALVLSKTRSWTLVVYAAGRGHSTHTDAIFSLFLSVCLFLCLCACGAVFVIYKSRRGREGPMCLDSLVTTKQRQRRSGEGGDGQNAEGDALELFSL